MTQKSRLDLVLVQRGFFESRARAQAAVMAGQVLVDGSSAVKPGDLVVPDALIELASVNPFVSRGGLKLQAALDTFRVDPRGRVCVDLGASTGGFTDCLLQRGAARVYAVDVGRGQLAAKLRADARVACLERLHARDLKPGSFSPAPDLAVADVSFISLAAVLPPLLPCLSRPFELLALVKPQFELGPKDAPKGVVRDPEKRRIAVEKIERIGTGLGLARAGRLECPVHGPKGNVETFIFWRSA